MNRIELAQAIIDKENFQNYLEIGSRSGLSFLPIRCNYKIAIDPKFVIAPKYKLKQYIKNPSNFRNKYFEGTSDVFFEKRVDLLQNRKIDVALIDGLHNFETALNDALNCIKYLNAKGTIIMHDCLPCDAYSATPANSIDEVVQKNYKDWNGQWCGDVWKTIVYLRRKFDQFLDVYVIDTDFGLGIIQMKQPIDKEQFKIDKTEYDAINDLLFEDMILQKEQYLGLISEQAALTKLDLIINY